MMLKTITQKINTLHLPIMVSGVMIMFDGYHSLEERQRPSLKTCELMKGFDTSSTGD